MTNYFDTVANSANQLLFDSVPMYGCAYSSLCTNYENLFVTYTPGGAYNSDAPSNSLFNINNMQQLVALGMNTPNILTNTTATYNTDFNLTAW
jgi:hypothetical protein